MTKMLVDKWITPNDCARSATASMITDLMRALQPLRSLRLRRLLDIGCGFGGLTRMIGEYLKIPEIHGIDQDASGLEEAREKGVTAQQFGVGGRRLPFADDYFDLVTSFGMLDYFSSWDGVLQEIFRVMQPDGHILISLPNLGSWHNRLCLLLGYQPRDVEVSMEILAGVHPWYKADSNPAGHARSITVSAFQELMAHHRFGCVSITGARPRGRRIPGLLALADSVLTQKATLARRFFYLGVKSDGMTNRRQDA